jgi:hypothetical protein
MKDPVRFGGVAAIDLALDKFKTPAVDLGQQYVGFLCGDFLNFFF